MSGFHERFFPRGSMNESDVDVTVLSQLQCFSGSNGDDIDMDPCSILENRKKIGEQSGVVCAGGGGQLQALRCEKAPIIGRMTREKIRVMVNDLAAINFSLSGWLSQKNLPSVLNVVSGQGPGEGVELVIQQESQKCLNRLMEKILLPDHQIEPLLMKRDKIEIEHSRDRLDGHSGVGVSPHDAYCRIQVTVSGEASGH
jgi:hypothetical protein